MSIPDNISNWGRYLIQRNRDKLNTERNAPKTKLSIQSPAFTPDKSNAPTFIHTKDKLPLKANVVESNSAMHDPKYNAPTVNETIETGNTVSERINETIETDKSGTRGSRALRPKSVYTALLGQIARPPPTFTVPSLQQARRKYLAIHRNKAKGAQFRANTTRPQPHATQGPPDAKKLALFKSPGGHYAGNLPETNKMCHSAKSPNKTTPYTLSMAAISPGVENPSGLRVTVDSAKEANFAPQHTKTSQLQRQTKILTGHRQTLQINHQSELGTSTLVTPNKEANREIVFPNSSTQLFETLLVGLKEELKLLEVQLAINKKAKDRERVETHKAQYISIWCKDRIDELASILHLCISQHEALHSLVIKLRQSILNHHQFVKSRLHSYQSKGVLEYQRIENFLAPLLKLSIPNININSIKLSSAQYQLSDNLSQVQQMNNVIDSLATETLNMAEAIVALEESAYSYAINTTETLESVLTEEKRQIAARKATIDRINELNEEYSTRKGECNVYVGQITQLNTESEMLDCQIYEENGMINDIATKMNDLDQNYDALTMQSSELFIKQEQIAADTAQLSEEIQLKEGTISHLILSKDDIEKRITKLEKDIAGIEETDSIANKLDCLANTKNSIERPLEDLNRALQDNDKVLGEYYAKLSEKQRVYTSLQNTRDVLSAVNRRMEEATLTIKEQIKENTANIANETDKFNQEMEQLASLQEEEQRVKEVLESFITKVEFVENAVTIHQTKQSAENDNTLSKSLENALTLTPELIVDQRLSVNALGASNEIPNNGPEACKGANPITHSHILNQDTLLYKESDISNSIDLNQMKSMYEYFKRL